MGQQVTLPDDLIRRVDAIVGTDGRDQFVPTCSKPPSDGA